MEYRKLGRFLLDRTLARGGMGEIIRSVDEAGRTVALKKILKEFETESQYRELFKKEAELTFQLDHPNIVRAYNFTHVGNQLVLALEYLEGVNLRDILNRAHERNFRLPLNIVGRIMRGVLQGLQYAHAKKDVAGEPLGVIHRDMNPANIFVTFLGDVKILDFGISKARSTAQPFGESGSDQKLRGKVCYLSPEQIRDEKVDRRTDIFACGIVLWEMLTGQSLFYRDSQAMVMDAILSGEIPSLHKYRKDVPESLERVLRKALATSPSSRFKDCGDFLKALDLALAEKILPEIVEEDLSIFVRTLFQQSVAEREPHFLSGHAFLLTQTPGLERAGVELAQTLVKTFPNVPIVRLNFARCLLAVGNKMEGLRALGSLSQVESFEEICHRLWVWLGVRRPLILPFLSRRHFLNRILGRLRHRILGPTQGQIEMQLKVA